jgi:glutamyl-tRNA reductase
MSIWALGLNHISTPLDLRARFAFNGKAVSQALFELQQVLDYQREITLLSTCNRTEIYGTGDRVDSTIALHWLAQQGNVKPQDLYQHLYDLQSSKASKHIFRVASGLDSMVLGEPQILGQLKEAVRIAKEVGTLGSTLHQLFQRSFAIAKTVRSTTSIGHYSISMPAAAVRLAAQIFEDLKKIKVLFVGSGEMISLAIPHFVGQQPQQIAICSRNAIRGTSLAKRFGGTYMGLAELPETLHEFDIVVSCTNSTLPIIGLGAVERALKTRYQKPMFMLDLALPRDIEAEVKSLEDVFLYTIDDLKEVVKTGKANRQAAVIQAENIVQQGVLGFEHWLAQRKTIPLLKRLQNQAQDWQKVEVKRAEKHLKKLMAEGQDPGIALEHLARGLSKKMLHGVMTELRRSGTDEYDQVQKLVKRFFLRN